MARHRKSARRKIRENRSLIKFAKVLFLLFDVIGFPKYFSRFSKRDSTTWQLFALCIICTKSKQSPEDFIGHRSDEPSNLRFDDFVEQFLPAADGLVRALGLERLPTSSTLRKFARRLRVQWAHTTLLITPVRNADVPLWRTKGADRKRLKRHFPMKKYHKRGKTETVFGVVKQMFGDAVRATTFRMQKIELLFRYLACNIDRILKLQKKRKSASAFSDELKITLAADAA